MQQTSNRALQLNACAARSMRRRGLGRNRSQAPATVGQVAMPMRSTGELPAYASDDWRVRAPRASRPNACAGARARGKHGTVRRPLQALALRPSQLAQVHPRSWVPPARALNQIPDGVRNNSIAVLVRGSSFRTAARAPWPREGARGRTAWSHRAPAKLRVRQASQTLNHRTSGASRAERA